MTEKINWMLGMTDNMLGLAEKNKGMPMMDEMYSMISTLMGNLNHMKMMENMDMHMVGMMEKMMMHMDPANDMQKGMMKNMMKYMIVMQMNMMMTSMSMNK